MKEHVKERYTLEQAAQFISDNSTARYESILKKLMDAVRQGSLQTYEPGMDEKYHPKVVRGFYEEAYLSDLNAWLNREEPRLNFRILPDIESLGIGNRGLKLLKQHGYETTEKLIEATLLDLFSINRLGKKTLTEIKDKLCLSGLSLRSDE